MPLPMVHLAVALEVCHALGREASPELLLGSLAPDAIHMRQDATPDDKSRVHLHQALLEAQGFLPARRLYEALVAERPALDEIALGYAAHLITDALWFRRVFTPFGVALGLPRGEERALYYRETDEVDRLLYVGAPWRPAVWRALAAARPADLPGLLSAAEIGRWRDRTLAWFDTLPSAAEPPRHLTLARTQAFISETAAALAGELTGWNLAADETGAASQRPL